MGLSLIRFWSLHRLVQARTSAAAALVSAILGYHRRGGCGTSDANRKSAGDYKCHYGAHGTSPSVRLIFGAFDPHRFPVGYLAINQQNDRRRGRRRYSQPTSRNVAKRVNPVTLSP
jgi:hypothetical protein